MTEELRVRNAHDLARSLLSTCPILSDHTATYLADMLTKSDEGWRPWREAPKDHAVIVGKDALGFVHNATHLLGHKDGQWIEAWKLVKI